jgi:predicted phosphate transport protein (TIGR00153 family)
MRIPFISMFRTSPFDGLLEHTQMLKECAGVFQQAMECAVANRCETFEEFRQEVDKLEGRADIIKRRIRGHIPVGTLMPVDKFSLFRYLREQDSIFDAMEEALDWISYRSDPGIPADLQKDFIILVDAVVYPIEEMSEMIVEARNYFRVYSEKKRIQVKNIVRKLHELEHEADRLEDNIKKKVLNMDIDPVTIFHMVRLAETIGSIADHAENAGDMMRAMVAK